jgi:acetate kinase
MPSKEGLGRGLVERIGAKGSILKQSGWNGTMEMERSAPDHKAALTMVTEALVDEQNGILESLEEVWGIGHRVVHGGEKYAESVVITDEVIKAIDENIELAPLHNPANLTGIIECMDLFPKRTQVAVFDTAFHQTLTPAAYLYGLPRELYEQYRIRRYGFHGTSHRYVANQAVKYAKRSMDNTNVISCHLGNGASITAIENGRSVDTSMGFTPLEGLMMGTRSGDLDPSIIFYLMERGYTAEQLNRMLNKESGLLGLSQKSNDLRDLEEAAERGDRNAIEALDVYAYRVRKFIGAYAANIVKVDILVFTGGIGQYGTRMRERICNRLENLGIVMDYRKNLENGPREGIISKDYSPTTIVVEPTNEELQIAIDTFELCSAAGA